MVSSQSLRPAAQIIKSNQVPPQPPLKKSAVLTTATGVRGNPPPIPPNKPIIPVKRDQNSRIPFATGATGANAVTTTKSCDFEEVPQAPIFSSK